MSQEEKYGFKFALPEKPTVFDIIKAGFNLEPCYCIYCHEPNVIYHQYIGDGACEMCGKWQLDEIKDLEMKITLILNPTSDWPEGKNPFHLFDEILGKIFSMEYTVQPTLETSASD